jgi:hypothetical protein
MFGVILISAVTAMPVYVLWRAGSVPFLRRQVTGKMLIITAIVLWALFLLGRVYGHDSPGTLAMVLELSGMTWTA